MTHPLRTKTDFSRLTDMVSAFMDCLLFVLFDITKSYRIDIIMLLESCARRKRQKNRLLPRAKCMGQPKLALQTTTLYVM